MRQSPTARAYRTVGWTIALVVVLLSDAVVATAGDAPRSLRSSASDAASVVLSDTEARRITDCARLNALTPDQVAAFLRGGGRHLNSCDKPVDGLGPEAQKKAEKEAQAAKEANEKQKIAEWEKRKQPTPEQIEAQANADKARDALKQAQAAAADAELTLKKMRETNNAASSADYVALQKQRQEVEAKQEAAASAEQSYKSANDALEYANAAKRRDEQEAQADAVRREEIATQRAEWKAQADADAKARAQMQEQLKAIKTKREQDVAQAEADRKQAELDQQLTDDKLRKQREAERQQREAERQQREREADTKQKQLSEDEEARLQRERDAKEAAAQRDAEEAEIKQREEARKARDQEIKDAAVKAKDAEAEFKRKKEEQDATKKKYDELEKKRLDEEIARAEAEAKAKADRDKADADAKQKEEDVPDEEKPKRDDEDDCPPSPVGSPPKCENGGRCFQVKGKPEAQRCSCGKGYKGDRCEHKPCPPPAKEGNMVNGKCVKWETEYFCPGCNKIWDLKTTCHEIDTKTSVKKDTPEKSCKGLKEPKNERYNRMCKFCLGGEDVKEANGMLDPSVWELGTDDNGADDAEPEDGETRHRQLVPAPAPVAAQPTPHYEFVRTFTARVIPPQQSVHEDVSVPDRAFVYSVYEHELVSGQATTLNDLTQKQCIASCYVRMGTAQATGTMSGAFCTWALWLPPYELGQRVISSKCRIFNSNKFPDEANANPMGEPTDTQPAALPSRPGTGMLVFATYPRVFDMLRASNNRNPLPTRAIGVGHPATPVTAYFKMATKALPREGTYVTMDAPVWGGCVATTRTQWEASEVYMRRTGAAATRGVRANYERTDLRPNAVDVVATSPIAAPGLQWRYTFDAQMRVRYVRPSRSLVATDIGSRGTDSPSGFQVAFRDIMRPRPGVDAGHLVAASLKPPSWFFNFVPQHKNSNQRGGCWFHTEVVAKGLMRLGCEVTYGIGLEYPPATGGNINECKLNFAPTRMALDVRITGGHGSCAPLYRVWHDQPLVAYNQQNNALTTTRLMAYVLHNASDDGATTNLRGLLHFATASADVNDCNANTGDIHRFKQLTLTTAFLDAKLRNGPNCLASRTLVQPAADVLYMDSSGCEPWRTRDTDTPDNLLDESNDCITMVQVNNVFVAAVGYPGSTDCLKFIYERDPFSPFSAPPLGSVTATSQDADLITGLDINAVVTGLIATVDQGGRMLQCLVYNSRLRYFTLTQTHADCFRLRVSVE